VWCCGVCSRMTPEEIAKARELAAKATPWPWYARFGVEGLAGLDGPTLREVDGYTCFTEEDAAFIAAARPGWPAALDALEKAQARIAELETALRQYADSNNWKCPRCKGSDHINCFMGVWTGPVNPPANPAISLSICEGHGYDIARNVLGTAMEKKP
jgi:hypothetical protein